MDSDIFERGVLVIPKAKYTLFRKVFIDYYNALLQKDFLEAKQIYPEVKSAGLYLRGEEKHQARVDVIAKHCGENLSKEAVLNSVKFNRLYAMLFTEDDSGDQKKLQSPKMNQIPYLPPTGDVVIPVPFASISFRNSSHSVRWEVRGDEANCEAARSHPISREFFRRLTVMEWTTGSGGKISRKDSVEKYGKLFL